MSETSKRCAFCGAQLVVCHEETLGVLPTPANPQGVPATDRRLHCNFCGICFEADGKTFFEGNDPRIGVGVAVAAGNVDAKLADEHSKALEQVKDLTTELKNANTDYNDLVKKFNELNDKVLDMEREAGTKQAGSPPQADKGK